MDNMPYNHETYEKLRREPKMLYKATYYTTSRGEERIISEDIVSVNGKEIQEQLCALQQELEEKCFRENPELLTECCVSKILETRVLLLLKIEFFRKQGRDDAVKKLENFLNSLLEIHNFLSKEGESQKE